MVNLTDGSRETMDSAAEYVREQGYSIPVTYFIDADGNGAAQARGALDGETLRMGIEMIAGE